MPQVLPNSAIVRDRLLARQIDVHLATIAQCRRHQARRHALCLGELPHCNLYNRKALPAVPLRSDDWPMPKK
jgi:hypothetical protein